MRCTVNLEIWYTIDECYRPYHIPRNQFYDYISYSKHKRFQLSDRLAIARNKIQCNATILQVHQRFQLISFERNQVLIDAEAYFDSV